MNPRRHLTLAALALGPFVLGLLVVLSAESRAASAIPASDRKALERTLASAFRALPVPVKEFHQDRSSGTRVIVPGTTARAAAAKAPAEARQVRVYERLVGTGEEAEAVGLEVRVYVNQEGTLPEPLASEAGTPQTFTHDGLPGMRVSLAGVPSGRVALPLTADEAANALTVVRLYVGLPPIEPYLEEIAQGRQPERTPWDSRPPRRASEVRTVVVEFQGPRGEVERLVKATSAAPLRALLSP